MQPNAPLFITSARMAKNLDENAAYDPEDDVEGHADFPEGGEAITARAKHVGVGLMSDGRGKTRGTTKHDRNSKWSRIDSQRRCDLERDRSQEQSDGVVA